MPDAQPRAGPRHRLEARLLGGLDLRYNGRPLPETAFHRRKSLLLLLRLLISPGHRLPTDTVLEMLWPEQDPQASAVNLRAVIGAVRAALPDPAAPHPLVRRDASLAIAPALDLALDSDQFEAAAAAGLTDGDPAALQRALALYAGPLLPGLQYEEWVVERSAALARVHRQVLLTLAAEGGAATEERLRALLTEDPADEQAGQALMRLLGARGRRAEALRVHHTLVSALEEELGVEPGPETEALHAALLEPPAPRPPSLATVPALPPTDIPGHNLPAALSSFVGRTWERAELRQLLERTRLLTLAGPGGAGKTRLALALAEERLATFPRGAWLVELAPAGNGAAVTQAVAHALGLREEPGRPLVDTLAAHLADGAALLLLDNCEHVLDACAALVDKLLRACPDLRVLATSRERLGLTGEAIWRIPPLSLPSWGASQVNGMEPSLAQLAQAEAVQLFVERVRSMRPGFALTAENAAAVAEICRRLEGIPLALELAAARAGMLTVAQIAARLDDRFRLLTGGSRAALPRQQTLRASIDWSYDLLAEPERVLLGRLSVFAGGWALAAAEAVCAGEDITPGDVLDLLDGLVSKSLVQTDEASGEARYWLLETVREYAQERLEARGEGLAARERHLAWCLTLAEEAAPQLTGPVQATWLLTLEAEHNNMREALRWAMAGTADVAAGVALTGSLWRFWKIRGYWTEGRRWLEAAIERGASAPGALRARALAGAGVLAADQGDYARAVALYEESLAQYRERGDKVGIAASLNSLGTAAVDQGEAAHAVALYEESLSIVRELGDTRGVAMSLSNLAQVAWRQGDYARAVALQEEGLTLDRQLGDKGGVAVSLSNLGILARHLGDYRRATALQEESLAIKRELGHTRGIAASLENLGNVERVLGDYAQATAHYEESLAIMRELGDARGVAQSLSNLGGVACDQGDFLRAGMLLEESLARMRALGNRRGTANTLNELGCLAAEQGESERAGGLLEESLALFGELADRRGSANVLTNLGVVARDRGDVTRAIHLLEESLSSWHALGDAVGSAEALRALASLAYIHGDDALALARYGESLALLRLVPGKRGISACLEGAALVVAPSLPEKAGWLLASAESLRASLGVSLAPRDRAKHEGAICMVRTALGEAAFADVWAVGRSLSLEGIIDEACMLAVTGTVQGHIGHADRRGVVHTAGHHEERESAQRST